MSVLELRIPREYDKEEVMKYKEEFIDSGDSMDGTNGLKECLSYEEWYKLVNDDMKEETVRKGFVPATTYLCIRKSDDRIVGMINVRHYLNDLLLNFGGNIGYSIRKSERRKGYAKEMLNLALMKCRSLGIKKALLTCSKKNIGSAKTIKANGGILENELPQGNRITQRYWIAIDR